MGAGWERRLGWTYKSPQGAPALGNEPAVHISWTEAQAFCADAGGSPAADTVSGAAERHKSGAGTVSSGRN